MKKLIAIVAFAPNRIIGNQGALPWNLPEDLRFFKKTTLGHTIVMGRKTYESIGRPLPNRRNVVLTRDPAWSAEQIEVIHDPREIVKLCESDESDEIFIIGGAEIYLAFAPILQEIIVSHVHHAYLGDTYFPDILGEFPVRETLATFAEFDVVRYRRDS